MKVFSLISATLLAIGAKGNVVSLNRQLNDFQRNLQELPPLELLEPCLSKIGKGNILVFFKQMGKFEICSGVKVGTNFALPEIEASESIFTSPTKDSCKTLFSKNIPDPVDGTKNITVNNKELYCLPILSGSLLPMISDIKALVAATTFPSECPETLKPNAGGPVDTECINNITQSEQELSSDSSENMFPLMKRIWANCTTLAPEITDGISAQSQEDVASALAAASATNPPSAPPSNPPSAKAPSSASYASVSLVLASVATFVAVMM
jgi:hypothetical protein